MIPHNRPTIGIKEQEAASRTLSSGWVAQGKEVKKFESEICNYLGLPEGHAVMVSSGSAALYLALWVLNGKNKRVGIPAYSCASLRNAVGMINGTSIFLDCSENSPNIDIKQAGESNLDILIAPSMFGIPIDIPDFENLSVVEDIAQSLGAKINGKRIGLRGDVGICSFYATKIITSGGQGGAVISKDKKLIDKIKDYRQFDCRDDANLRFNFQMTDLQASIGRLQLVQLPNFIERREQLFCTYQDAGLKLLDSQKGDPVRYRAVMRCSNPQRVINALQLKNIQAIIPIEEFELLDNPQRLPVAKNLTNSSVSLPIYPTLTDDDQLSIIKIVKEVI